MSISWKSPSNIALIKYWGKHGKQLPRNASISFTLSEAFTQTSLQYEPKAHDGAISLDFTFAGAPNEAFKTKIVKFLQSAATELPFLTEYHLTMDSFNSFPHSAGIASSASSMSALACCMMSMSEAVGFSQLSQTEFEQRASYWSRLASGSACRSIFDKAALWGQTPHWAAGSDLYAVGFGDELHPIFGTYYDDILLVSKAEKSVSSTAGHHLMEGNPFAAARYQQANDNMGALLPALQAGDVERVGELIEEEALTLHALMMSSRPSFILLAPNSLKIIQLIRQWRNDTGLPLYFSIDAGPNLHLLYPADIHKAVQAFIQTELLTYCEQNQHLTDKVGAGATRL